MEAALVAVWLPEEDDYLRSIHRSCSDLQCLYGAYHEHYKFRTAQFRLPAIVFGGLTSAISFSADAFPVPFRGYVNVFVGGTSLAIAILNTLESYFEYSKIMAGALSASLAFKKIADDILCELSLPMADRETAGVFFLRTVYTRYQHAISLAPYLNMSDDQRDAVRLPPRIYHMGARSSPEESAAAPENPPGT